MNRKIKYTKSVIKSAFLSLLSQQDIEKVSVKELCVLADINRSTFYMHYENINDLTLQLENEISELSMNLIDFKDIGGNIEKIYLDVFTNIQKNSDSFSLIIYNPSSIRAIDNLLDQVYKIHASNSFSEHNIEPILYEYAFEFLLFGSKQVISKWISTGCSESPEEMAKLMGNLISNI